MKMKSTKIDGQFKIQMRKQQKITLRLAVKQSVLKQPLKIIEYCVAFKKQQKHTQGINFTTKS